jgi:hypothetical protein
MAKQSGMSAGLRLCGQRLPLSVIAKSAAMKQSRGARMAGLLRCCAPRNDEHSCHSLLFIQRISPLARTGKRQHLPLSVIAKSAAMKQSGGVRMAGLLRCFAPRKDDYSCHFLLFIQRIFTLALILATCASCEKDDGAPITALKNTKWKLAGIVDVRTGTLKELEPKDCEKCYTLEFDTDSTAWGTSIMNEIRLKLSPTPFMTVVSFAYDHEMGDVQLFYDAMKTINSCTVTENTMKLFYNERKNFLLYKLQS